MKIGALRETQVCLKCCDWVQLICSTGRFLTALLFPLFIMIAPAQAVIDSVPAINAPPTIQTVTGWTGWGGYYSTPQEACTANVSHAWGNTTATTIYSDPNHYNCYGNASYGLAPSTPTDLYAYCPKPNYYIGYYTQRNCSSFPATEPCQLTCTLSGSAQTCPTPTVQPNIPYVLNTATGMCERTLSDCPANSTRSDLYPYNCTCNTGYKFDAVGGICVPVTACLIPGLTPLTDQIAIDFDNNPGGRWRPDGLTAVYQEHVRCVERETRARGGTPVGTSAYRPEQYQRHLFEIVLKDLDLNTDYMIAHPECQALRAEITRKMGPSPGHGLSRGQDVAIPGTSRHESGTAFDLTPSGLNDAQRAEVYAACGVTNRAVRNERWHTQ